jgi:hypothetical protein
MAKKKAANGESKFFILFCLLVGICTLFVGPDNLPGEASLWAYVFFLIVAASLPISERYAVLARYLSTVSIFCGICAIAGLGMSGTRMFPVAWGAALVIVSLHALVRIIIWTWSSWEQVKRGAKSSS